MRTGLELELLAPAGKTRFDLARDLAAALGGDVMYGLKHVVDGFIETRPRCAMSIAARVRDAAGAPFATFVDDVTIREHVTRGADTTSLVIVDDTRIAKWLEARASAPVRDVDAIVQPLVETFALTRESERLVDKWGQVFALIANEPDDHARVAEVVTRPLEDDERTDAVLAILDAARELGCTVPPAAALHVHVDAARFQDTERLCRFIRNWHDRRDDVRARLRPNPACKKLGPFPDDVVRVARECPSDLPFGQLAAALKLAGAKKELDVNLLGVLDRAPIQPTLEVRCLPMSLDAVAVLASINAALAVLDEMLELH